MTVWQAPKVDWTVVDGVLDTDINRIEGNLKNMQERGLAPIPLAAAVTDWNNYVETGLYVGNNLANTPVYEGAHAWWYVQVISHTTSSYCIQIASDYSNKATFVRTRVGSVWNEWKRLLRSGDSDVMTAEQVIFKSTDYPNAPNKVIPGPLWPNDVTYNTQHNIFYILHGRGQGSYYPMCGAYDIDGNKLTSPNVTNYLYAISFSPYDGWTYEIRMYSNVRYIYRNKYNADGSFAATTESKTGQLPGTGSEWHCFAHHSGNIFYAVNVVTKVLYMYQWTDTSSPSVATLSFLEAMPISMGSDGTHLYILDDTNKIYKVTTAGVLVSSKKIDAMYSAKLYGITCYNGKLYGAATPSPGSNLMGYLLDMDSF